VALLGACAPTPPAPPPRATPAAPPRAVDRPGSRPAAGFCVTPFPSTEDGGDAEDLRVQHARVDGGRLAFCLSAGDGTDDASQCLSVDPRSGGWRAHRPAAAPVRADADARIEVGADRVKACPRPGACRTFGLPAGVATDRVRAALSASGNLLAVLVGCGASTGRTLAVFETATGKRRFEAPWGVASRSYFNGRPQWLGESLVLHLDLEAGPDGQSHLVDPTTGARTRWIGEAKPLNTYGSVAVNVGPGLWAFLAHDDSETVTYAEAGEKLVHRLDLDRRPAGARPPREGFGLHDVVPLPGARMAVIFGYPVPGQVEVYDARTGVRLARHRPPICPDAAPTPPPRAPAPGGASRSSPGGLPRRSA
jgi:hypothetical protein